MKKYLFAVLLFLSVPAMASTAEPLKVTYGLYAGGFNVVDINGTYAVKGENYDLSMNLKTIGLLGSLAPWSGVLKTNGQDLKPREHSFASTWRGETETSEFKFAKDGTLQSYKKYNEDGSVKDKMPSKDVYENGAIDTLSAMFLAMNQKSCAGTFDVTDGKRRFDMRFLSKGAEKIEKSKYTVFNGTAEKCAVEIIPTAGKWSEKPRGWMSIQDQAKANDTLPTLWFGKLRDDMPPVPVKFFIKTNYGAMVMHLKSVQ